ncbi:MAG: addiction module protein [Leptospirales bacterium]
MSVDTQDLLKKALTMEATERAFLAERLIASLETDMDAGVELAWQKEVQKRALELDSGKVETVSWDQIKNQMQQELSVKH